MFIIICELILHNHVIRAFCFSSLFRGNFPSWGGKGGREVDGERKMGGGGGGGAYVKWSRVLV